jgi:hypothetical protein
VRGPALHLCAQHSQPHMCMQWQASKDSTVACKVSHSAVFDACAAEDFFEPRLREAGYAGLFWPKACSPAEQYGYPCDGCALFFNSKRFEMLGPPCGESPSQSRDGSCTSHLRAADR